MFLQRMARGAEGVLGAERATPVLEELFRAHAEELKMDEESGRPCGFVSAEGGKRTVQALRRLQGARLAGGGAAAAELGALSTQE
jgi:hypothetical protein